MTRGALHHVELRTAHLDTASRAWGWLLGELGYTPFQEWPAGRSWRLGDVYLVLEAAPLDGAHDRRRPGLSHLAFHAGDAGQVEQLWTDAPAHGWTRLYEDRHPYAGGPDHRAAFLEDAERFKVELVAS
ncbi:glyoxalase/bleomycin resistance protein/dioxygenase superfamily protein [Curtobacterium sp. PhB142]|uniref:VOC family protein n=1 Tax=Bacteria TaxID=2 RepID=UPI000F4B5274|nr:MULTISPECIES: VOC family protein [unclassified Curtobacterium]ROS68845.1 glyoxalase/bleomycin resistance protein/dioxygenase superfamily protein [Curtobacterium sp. PhB172]TCL86170.1 glyoxalase/bleomycin resistance protein/dioxygenase superfamily protein [Curtobacterium sp. PhB142]TCM02360.1 glyoxalase/bleomycin resistance protein/dioxygenase superfamily protein [Curtobacterium sp. PhB134]TCU49886.1 glyoxalase/bleomycin resistance protein/dioxygenase superfamily protein [Curtobacterium sp. P